MTENRQARPANANTLIGHTEALLAHSRALHERGIPELDSMDQTVVTAANSVVRALIDNANLSAAMELGQETNTFVAEFRGQDHPDTLTSRNNLAYAYQSAGQLERAIPLYEATLTDRRRVLGEDHPLTVVVARNLSAALDLRRSTTNE